MNKYIIPIIIFLIILISLKFFEARFLGDLIGIKLPVIFITILVGISLIYFFSCKGKFVLPVQLLTISLLFSIVSAYIVWGQSIMDSLMRTMPLAVVPFFFLLSRFNVKINVLETVILIFGYLYFTLNIFQLLNPSTAYFGYALVSETGGYVESRGVTRVIFPGAGIFWLACFISVNKVLKKNENKYIHLPLVVLGLVIPVLQATRQLIVFSVGLYTFHFSVHLSLIKKVILSFLLIILAIYIVSLDLLVFQGLHEKSVETSSEGSKYIRLITGEYYLTEFSDTMFTKFFGNGVPSGKSMYGAVTAKLIDKGMFLEDVGIIGLYSQFGILSVIAWVFIWYKSFTIKLPTEYNYCKYYLWSILFTSLTSGSIYNIHFAISTTLVLFIFNQVELDKKNQFKRVLKFLLKRKLEGELKRNKFAVSKSHIIGSS
jgi:hypothetical protein